MTWPDEKLSDDPARIEEHLLDEGSEVRPTATVEAPCCGRRCAADMVCRVPGEGWKCDACRAALRRDPETPWTKPKLMRAMGAPPEEVRVEEAKRRARERYVAAKRRDEGPVDRTAIIEQALDELPEGEYPPDTEPPTTSGGEGP